MTAENKKLVRIDLNQFKLHLFLKSGGELTLHFDSPSRRFYLAVIGLVVHKMKKRGRLISIPLAKHLDMIALLNETVGGSAGSSQKKYLLPRIYRKWKDALPDLEKAPLFKVVGRKKRYDELMGKVYQFSEGEKDNWSNLFEYKGSHEHVRLRFSIDRLGADLDDVIIVYGKNPDTENLEAWDLFIENLKEKREVPSGPRKTNQPSTMSGLLPAPPGKWLRTIPGRWQWQALILVIALITGFTAFVIWGNNSSAPQTKIAYVEKTVLPLPDNQSIAILPFKNMSDDSKQDHFSDGMTEDLITDLSKISGLFVIARNSVFTYKRATKNIDEIARELGVRYILEGSVRKTGAKVRINIQLIDSATGGHVWAERYDRDLKNIFALQDEIVNNITSVLSVKLTKSEKVQLVKKDTNNLDAYDYYLRGIQAIHKKSLDDKEFYKNLLEAKFLFQKAIELDPNFARAYASHALVNYFAIENDMNGVAAFTDTRAEAMEYITQTLAIDPTLPLAHSVLAGIQAWEGRFEKAIFSAEKAISLEPNNANSHLLMAGILTQYGKHSEALKSINYSFMLNPKPPPIYYIYLGYIQFNNCQYASAIESFKKVEKTIGGVYRYAIVACYAHFGQIEKAKSEFIELEKLESGMSLAYLQQFARRFKEEKDRNHYMDGFKKAGVPEFPYGFEGDKENMLSTEEIGKLFMSKIQTGYISDTSMADWDKNRIQQWWMHYREDGTCNISGFWEDSCVYRFEDNKCYVKFKEMNDAKWFWWLIFRNPDGTPKELNDYVAVGQILLTFSVQ